MRILSQTLDKIKQSFYSGCLVPNIARGYLIKRSLNTTKMIIPTFDLNGYGKMPAVGYGTWMAKDDELERALDLALEAGYRHIDTAHAYENERVIGNVLKRWFTSGKLSRKDIFLVTKLPPSGVYPEGVSKYLNRSLNLLQVDYVDLYLVHTPFTFKDVEGDLHPVGEDGKMLWDFSTDLVGVWKAMEAQVDAGLTKAIGISNFNKSQIQRILNNARIPPCNLQIELHLYLQQNELVEFCKKNKIVVTAYSPLGSPGLVKFFSQFGQSIDLPDILHNPVVVDMAKKYNKTSAQILLRFTVQRGIAVIPKSTNAERLRQNINIFDFELTNDDMKKLSKLDSGVRLVDFKLFKGVEEHPEYPFKQ